MTHRSYQARIPCSNRLLQKKWDETYYQEHMRRLRTSKPMVDTQSPKDHPHVVHKQKKKQLESERNDIIDRDNLTLLHKMQRIMKTEGSVDHRNTYRHHSLNDLRRQRELERVQEENKSMLKRIQNAKPMYRVDDCIDSWKKNIHLTEMITTYPQPLPATKTKTKTTTLNNSVPGTINDITDSINNPED